MISDLLNYDVKVTPWEMVYELANELKINSAFVTKEEGKRMEEIADLHIEYNKDNPITKHWDEDYEKFEDYVEKSYGADEILNVICRIISKKRYTKIIDKEYNELIEIILNIYAKLLKRW